MVALDFFPSIMNSTDTWLTKSEYGAVLSEILAQALAVGRADDDDDTHIPLGDNVTLVMVSREHILAISESGETIVEIECRHPHAGIIASQRLALLLGMQEADTGDALTLLLAVVLACGGGSWDADRRQFQQQCYTLEDFLVQFHRGQLHGLYQYNALFLNKIDWLTDAAAAASTTQSVES